jgi:tetratricopeptide (TPR) repeat protein
MSAPCEHIERFADGELAPEEAEAFRQHLLDCDRCKAELGNLLQLKMMASRYAERQPAAPIPAPSRWSFSRWSVGAAVGAACAALIAVGVFRQSRSSGGDPWLMSEPERRLEMRLAIAAADQHRPMSARKMGQAPSQSAGLPLDALTELEREGNTAGLAAALLARNDKGLVAQAEAYLAPLPSTPQNETLRGVALLIKGAPAEALRHLERALEQAPKFSAALWNKALALRDLDLQGAAALTFREVTALGEPGWAEEARQRAEALSAAEQARTQRWTAVVSAGKELVLKGTLPSAEVLAERPPLLRQYFYDAVRTRTSPEQVRALLPLAKELDQQAGGGDVLARYIEHLATHDFRERARWAQAYAQLIQGTLPPQRVQALIDELFRSTEHDLLIGALVQAGAVGRHLDTFEASAKASQDPWFKLLAAQERAAAQRAQGEEEAARQTLTAALSACEPRLEHRCQMLRLSLIELQSKQQRLDEAWMLAEQTFRQARATNARDIEELALGHLVELARLRNDVPLERAYRAQLLTLKPGDKAP